MCLKKLTREQEKSFDSDRATGETSSGVGAFQPAASQQTAKAKKPKRLSRVSRWNNACLDAATALEELRDIQEEYEEWRNNLPESLSASPVGEKLDAVCELDIDEVLSQVSEFESVDLPLGFGKD